jgi:hypothetical protein
VEFRVFEEGSYSDDPIVVEYLGGVLASSRTAIGRDDRGNTLTALVARLSTYYLRSHFIFYSEFHRLLAGTDVNLHDIEVRDEQARMWMPMESYFKAMDFGEGEDPIALWTNYVYALRREDLIGFDVAGSAPYMQKRYPNVPGDGLVLRPTIPGMELFVWALGLGQGDTVGTFLEVRDVHVEGIDLRPTSRLMKDPPPLPSATA